MTTITLWFADALEEHFRKVFELEMRTRSRWRRFIEWIRRSFRSERENLARDSFQCSSGELNCAMDQMFRDEVARQEEWLATTLWADATSTPADPDAVAALVVECVDPVGIDVLAEPRPKQSFEEFLRDTDNLLAEQRARKR
jgi:hypothetical protein